MRDLPAFRFGLVVALGLSAWTAGAAIAAPRVVASIPPVHSLVAGVMQGIGEPALLLPGSASAHTYQLKPSDARLLDRADLVFWVGPDLEGFLRKPLRSLAGGRAMALAEAGGVGLLRNRASGAWERHEEDGHEAHGAHASADVAEHAGDAHSHGTYDMHLWLDPENAKAIVRTAVEVLSATDAANAARYAANGRQMVARLDALDAELRDTVAPIREVPFVVFHDAYQYFEHRYGLNAVGSVTLGPERVPGARQLYAVRSKIVESGARCVFSEPQFDAGLIGTVVEGTRARPAELDPLGAGISPGPDAYFILLRRLAAALRDCLAAVP